MLDLFNSIIRATPKFSNDSEASQHQPIALQPVSAKIIDSLLLEQMMEFLESSGHFFGRQFGFRRKLNCEYAVLDL